MRTSLTILLLALLASVGRPAAGTDCSVETTCCDQCGRYTTCCEKACQVVCEIKKEKKTCWCVECKEFGTLLPGCHKECCDSCCKPPRCGRCICAKKLVKREYEVERPVYKCVVLHLCPECCKCSSVESANPAPTTTTAPPVPAPTAAPLPPPPSGVQK
jgi:hypothetical protein